MAVNQNRTYADGEYIRCSFRYDNGKVYFAKNGTWHRITKSSKGS